MSGRNGPVKGAVIIFTVIVIVFVFIGFGLSSTNESHPRPEADRKLIDSFHRFFYTQHPFVTTFLGVQSLQYPMDNWMMQEIICDVKPDFIVETGTGAGGTALFYATVLEHVNPDGKVLTIDVNPHDPRAASFRPWKERVVFLRGSSIDERIVQEVKSRCAGKKVMVTLDAVHEKSYVLRELELYSPLVSAGSYLVVQDTHLGGNPVSETQVTGPSPFDAVREFLPRHSEFEVDQSRERFVITQYPGGFLKKIQ